MRINLFISLCLAWRSQLQIQSVNREAEVVGSAAPEVSGMNRITSIDTKAATTSRNAGASAFPSSRMNASAARGVNPPSTPNPTL